jgi:hypothetical protein
MNWRVAGRINPDQPVFNIRETILSKFALPQSMDKQTDPSDEVMITDPTQT